MGNKFSKYLTGFRKNHNTQNYRLRMIEFWKAKLKSGSKVGVIKMDLSKAFDSLNHDLLLTTLEAYDNIGGICNNAVSFMRSYRTIGKINNSFSEWVKISAGVLQGSILGLLLFNIFINDILFPLKCDLANYADDSATYTSRFYNCRFPEIWFIILPKWIHNNFRVLNPKKMLTYVVWCWCFITNQHGMWWWILKYNTKQEKVLRVTLDTKLNLATHLSNITKNANKKLMN